MNSLIADVIKFVSGTMIPSSQGGAAKSNLSSFQSLAPGLFLWTSKIVKHVRIETLLVLEYS